MSEENKALARRWAEEVMNRRNLDAVDEIYSSDFLGHDPTMPEDVRGVEGAREFYGMYQSAFPDAQITIEDQLAEGDKVVTAGAGRCSPGSISRIRSNVARPRAGHIIQVLRSCKPS